MGLPLAPGSTVFPEILLGLEIPEPLTLGQDRLLRAVVETHADRPDTFEVQFQDPDGLTLEMLGAVIGAKVVISGVSDADPVPQPLIVGEVTAIEAICEQSQCVTVLRGSDPTHRLQRAKHTRTWLEVLDTEAAVEIAEEAGLVLDPDQIIPSPVLHTHLAQPNQTDWEFLTWRAVEIGYEFGTEEGLFYFRPVAGGENIETAESAAETTPLVFNDGLRSFRPKVNAQNMTPVVEARIWEPVLGTAVSADLPAMSQVADILSTSEELSAVFADPVPEIPDEEGDEDPEALAETVSDPTVPDSTRLVDRPVGSGVDAPVALEQLAQSLSARVGSRFAETEGHANGNPAIQAGRTVSVAGVPLMFTGAWVVNRALHVFDPMQGGYTTRFWAGRNRTLPEGAGEPPRISGVVCGIVTNNQDPLQQRRVKIALPWMSQDYESDWVRVVQFGAGMDSGALFMPSCADEVLVAFEYGDIRRPYVIGGLINAKTIYHEAGLGPIEPVPPGEPFFATRGYVSPTGNRLCFQDFPESQVQLGTMEDNLGVTVSQTEQSVLVNCDTTTLLITPASVEITTEGPVSITAGPELNFTAGVISFEAEGSVAITAPTVEIAAEAELTASAPVILLGP
jgi:phage protein D